MKVPGLFAALVADPARFDMALNDSMPNCGGCNREYARTEDAGRVCDTSRISRLMLHDGGGLCRLRGGSRIPEAAKAKIWLGRAGYGLANRTGRPAACGPAAGGGSPLRKRDWFTTTYCTV
jgi:hypothetical protein